MNILLTSVGRRAYLVKYFKETVGQEGEIHCTNSDEYSVAFNYADYHAVSPLIYSKDYIPFLLDYCSKHNIDMLISLFDIDLLILSQNKSLFEEIGVRVIVSDESFILVCNDKWKTYNYLCNNGFHAPKTYIKYDMLTKDILEGKLHFPIVVKPRFGCGSIGLSIAENESDLSYLYKKQKQIILDSYLRYESANEENIILFQEKMQGKEYGVDVVNDLQGNNRAVFVKRKLAMRSGETDIAETEKNQAIYEEMSRLGAVTKHIGNLDCDVFFIDNTPYILEMNARFGGGYPFSHVAGANVPKAIVNWASGNEADDALLQIRYGVRSYKEIVITETHVE